MQNVGTVENVVRNHVAARTGSVGFFRRIAQKLGLAGKEVQECRGKTLGEMAEITSKKDLFLRARERVYEREKIDKPKYLDKLKLLHERKASAQQHLQKTDKSIERIQERIKELESKISDCSGYKEDNIYVPPSDSEFGHNRHIASELEQLRSYLGDLNSLRLEYENVEYFATRDIKAIRELLESHKADMERINAGLLPKDFLE